ncbi:MAG: cyclic nucleotide-binding domain-containing protein [Bacteroidetes bacterium]|nr:cyclic nucleotide-binding domain-containing protein [Bacteroidota bacterium]MBU1678246.1 cyclic nucleotide-binding domain-containing protein [Bacteroidota bacterium]MBU2508361.1 cyclic nucleotide-binding domain-containing protein [Bacteroidota bacterium]
MTEIEMQSESESKSKSRVNTFWGNIFSSNKDGEDTSHFELLKDVPLFSNLKRRELKAITNQFYKRKFESGEHVFETGQPGAAMFIVIEGEISIIAKRNNKNIELAKLGKGEFFGELALLDNSPRSADAIATRDTYALAIFREDLNKLMITLPLIGGKIIKKLAIIIGMRLKATNEMLSRKNENSKEMVDD